MISIFVVIFATSLAYAQERHDEHYSVTNSGIHQHPFRNFSFTWPFSIIQPSAIQMVSVEKNETNWRDPNCSYPNSHDESDLCEQRKMSTSADKTVFLGWWQLILSALGFLALLYTLNLTRRATRAAEKAAEISLEQSRIAKTDAETPLRAFLLLKWVKIYADGRIELEIINKGQTPANNVAVKIKAGSAAIISDQVSVLMEKSSIINAICVPIGIQIFPANYEGFSCEISDYCLINQPTISGKITYKDWFGNDCATTFWLQSRGDIIIYGPRSHAS